MSLARKILYNKTIDSYLKDLRLISGNIVRRGDLLDLDRTQKMREKSRDFSNRETYEFEIDFDKKASTGFRSYIEKLHKVNPGRIFVWLPETFDCGAYSINSLLDLNWEFRNHEMKSDIIVLVNENFQEKILLDIFDNDVGEKRIKLEICGEKWPSVIYQK
ncbi:hypothetical protein [Kiloniella majae]|uniref:hypothetical protein n=1 Tax=Kiloniella majae TaxID=1938558 RepID=UPI000A27832C|nr:hypothetical protein [Kiloniella majae]